MEPTSLARTIVVSAATALIGAALVVPAHALTSDSFTYSTTKVGYLSISPAALIHDGGSAASESHFFSWFGSKFTITNSACYNAPINLPEGAKIISFVVWYSDADIFAKIFQNQLFTGVSSDVGFVSGPTSATRRYALASTTPTTVANALNSYAFGVCPGPNGTFYGARIQYTYTSAGN